MGRTTLSTGLQVAMKEAGLSSRELAEHLGLKYTTLQYRIRSGGLSLEDYWKITAVLDKSFEALFPNPYRQIQRSQTIPRIVQPVKQQPTTTPVPPDPTVAKKEEKPIGLSSATAPKKKFRAIDIGIPKIDEPRKDETDFVPPPPVVVVDLPPGFLKT